MSRWKGRALFAALAVCLMLLHTVNAFAAVPEATPSQASIGHGEPGVEEPEPEEPAEPEPENPIELEPEPENPVEPEETDTVFNVDDLAEWMEQHKGAGGTVSLGDSVTITQDMGIYGIIGEITIDTGSFGLVFQGGMLPTGNVFITGEGVNMPVVDVMQIGSGLPYEPSWNSTLLQMNVTATGRDGVGGTALRISAADNKDFGMDSLLWQGVIRSYGKGAVGLWLAVPMEAWCYKVEVFGENSVAVYAPNGADLFYCKLTAEGDGVSAAAGDDLLLDSCAASPTPTGVTSVSRRAMEESFSRLYLPVEQNGSLFGAMMLFNTPNVFLIDEEGGVISRPFPVYWDESYDINTEDLGTTLVPGTVDPDLYGLGIFDDVPISLTVEVRDPALPCISQIAVRELDGARYAVLNFWQEYDPAEESVILWRSDDEGETWQDATHAPDISWDGDSVNFTYETLEHSVWFQLEVTGIGESNIAILDERDGVFIGGNGGDRTGTDRGGVNPPSGGNNDSGNDGGNGTSDGGQPGSGNTPGTVGDSGDGDEEQPDSGNGSTPKAGEETNNSDGNQSGSNGDIPDTGIGTSDRDDSVAQVGSSEDDETEVHTVTAIPAATLPLDKETEAVPAENPTAAAPAGIVPTEDQTEATQTQPTAEPEKDIIPAKEEVPVTEEATMSFDPEQSAPEPGFSAKALTVFFLGVAGLSSGALLVLRFGGHGRWRREKP